MSNSNIIRITLLALCTLMCTSCLSGLINVSSRNIHGAKQGSLVPKEKRDMDYGPERKDYDVYLKVGNQIIEETEQENTTGSLANVNDSRNNLFSKKDPIQQGQYLDLKIVAARGDSVSEAGTTPTTVTEGETEVSEDALVNDIIKSLPSLEPADGSATVMSNLKVMVNRIHNNGDLTVIYRRSSVKEQETYEMFIKAKIPAQAVSSPKPIDTNDLVDIQWIENDNGDVIERHSPGWEDEYTLRLSGFTEAKSRYALELEDKRNMLMDIRKNLENQLNSIGKERKNMASQRDNLLKAKNDQQKRADELESKLKEVQTKLDTLNQKTEEQKPEENTQDQQQVQSKT